MTTDGDALTQRCCLSPHDHSAHLIFADWLAEHGEVELEAVMRDETKAARVLMDTWRTAVALKVLPSLRLLWCVVCVINALREEEAKARRENRDAIHQALATIRTGQPVVMNADGAISEASLARPNRDGTASMMSNSAGGTVE